MKAGSSTIMRTFTQAQINYAEKYIVLFSAYNAWYRHVTGESVDARALELLKYRDALWIEYKKGECLERLRPLVRKLVILTAIRPVAPRGNWCGSISDANDYEGMMQFWYTVRCAIVHSNEEMQSALYSTYISLAYDSLNIYMTEVVLRLHHNNIGLNKMDAIESEYGSALHTRKKYADFFSRY
jgi:hypothetical protein